MSRYTEFQYRIVARRRSLMQSIAAYQDVLATSLDRRLSGDQGTAHILNDCPNYQASLPSETKTDAISETATMTGIEGRDWLRECFCLSLQNIGYELLHTGDITGAGLRIRARHEDGTVANVSATPDQTTILLNLEGFRGMECAIARDRLTEELLRRGVDVSIVRENRCDSASSLSPSRALATSQDELDKRVGRGRAGSKYKASRRRGVKC